MMEYGKKKNAIGEAIWLDQELLNNIWINCTLWH